MTQPLTGPESTYMDLAGRAFAMARDGEVYDVVEHLREFDGPHFLERAIPYLREYVEEHK